MAALTRLHWILIVYVAIIVTAGLAIGIWQAVVAGNDEKSTVLTTPTTSQSTNTTTTTSRTTTSTRSPSTTTSTLTSTTSSSTTSPTVSTSANTGALYTSSSSTTTTSTTTSTATSTTTIAPGCNCSLMSYFSNATLNSSITSYNGISFNYLMSTEMAIVNNIIVYFLADWLNNAIVRMSDSWQYITKTNTITYPRIIKWANDHLYVSSQHGFFKTDYNLNIINSILDQDVSYNGIYHNASDNTLVVAVWVRYRIDWVDADLNVLANMDLGSYIPVGVAGYGDSLYVSAFSFAPSTVIYVIRNRVIINTLTISNTNGMFIYSIVFDDFGYMALSFAIEQRVVLYHINGTSTGLQLTFPSYVFRASFDNDGRLMICTSYALYFYNYNYRNTLTSITTTRTLYTSAAAATTKTTVSSASLTQEADAVTITITSTLISSSSTKMSTVEPTTTTSSSSTSSTVISSTTRTTSTTTTVNSSTTRTTSNTTLIFTYEKCATNSPYPMNLVNNGRYLVNDPAFKNAFDGPYTSTNGVPTKYECCDLCSKDDSCFLFEYIFNTGDCKFYKHIGSGAYNPNILLALVTLDGAYCSGFYTP